MVDVMKCVVSVILFLQNNVSPEQFYCTENKFVRDLFYLTSVVSVFNQKKP